MEARRAVQELSEALIPSILDGLGEPAIILDLERRIVTSNQKYRDRFFGGKNPSGRCCFEISHRYSIPCDQMGESCPWTTAKASGERARSLHVHHTSEGERHETVSVYPLFDPDGRVRFFLEILAAARFSSAGAPGDATLVGFSAPFTRMLDLVSKVAATSTAVLLLGESGTGKDLVARALHYLSARARGAFVPLDCSGLTETLFESELFGHEKGAFTGAHERRRGLAEAADGGTLFLDEVGDIPLPLQVKLLRLIETGVFRRVGNAAQLHSDFRLVCATHRDLVHMVKAGEFREDLYYRISVFPIPLPPLRERTEDIPILAEAIFRRLGCGDYCHIDAQALELLRCHGFPGNIRELHNILERACLLTEDGRIRPEHLPAGCGTTGTRPGAGPPPLDAREVLSLEAMERRYVRWIAAHYEGSRADLAARLGISERTLYRKLGE